MGENGHGILIRMVNSARENQIAMLLNFCLSVAFLFAISAPKVIKTMAVSIMVLCSMPKKRTGRS